MCNSYNNGYCDYYGVEVRELNYKCERCVCMDEAIKKAIEVLKANNKPPIIIKGKSYYRLIDKNGERLVEV